MNSFRKPRRRMLTPANSIQIEFATPKQTGSALRFFKTLKTIGILGKDAWIEKSLVFVNTILVKYE